MRPALIIRFIIVLILVSLGACAPATGPTAPAPAPATFRPPAPGEYIAFSLAVAQERIEAAGQRRDWRTTEPEVFQLGGINNAVGLVIDRARPDIILVGHHDPDRPPLTLDDFAVALRARFVHGAWPLVSIDPTEETERTGLQRVRMEGGIEDTAFGADLLDADYRLKKISMGLLDAGVPNFETYWDLGAKSAVATKISARFWFFPIISNVAVREDVAAVKGLKVGVLTEVLAAEFDGTPVVNIASYRDPQGDAFAETVSARFEELSRAHPSFARVKSLNELLALTKALEDMENRPDLAFWLDNYRITKIKTPRDLKNLSREQKFKTKVEDENAQFKLYCMFYNYTLSSSGDDFCQVQLRKQIQGGVHLQAIALRLRSGDPSALKDAVLSVRPKTKNLTWTFIVADWILSTEPGSFIADDVVPLLRQAVFLGLQERHDEVIALCSRIIELKDDWDLPYLARSFAYAAIGKLDHAVADVNRALDLNPHNADAYRFRGGLYLEKNELDHAIADLDQAIALNPRNAGAYIYRGMSYIKRNDPDRAITAFNQALTLDPRNAEAYSGRGAAYYMKTGQLVDACADIQRACELGNCNLFHARKFSKSC